MSREDEVRNLIIAHHRRLHVLKCKKALFGFNVPPEIELEIENIEQQIKQLQVELDQITANKDPQKTDKVPPPSSKKLISPDIDQAEIILKGSASSISSGLQWALLRVLADILDVAPTHIRIWDICDTHNGNIGLHVEMPSAAVEQLIALYDKDDAIIRDLGIQQVRLAFKLHDRGPQGPNILNSKANHIELYGPSGVGKTHLLRHIFKRYENVRSVYIDLTIHATPDKIVSEAVRQLKDEAEPQPAATTNDLAAVISELYRSEHAPNHFLFLFDSATEKHRTVIDWLISQDGLINCQPFLATLKAKDADRVKVQVVIAAQQPIVKIRNYHPNLHFTRLSVEPLQKNPEDPIQGMLMELAAHKKFSMTPQHCLSLSDQVYYLTGGHPKCAKSVLFAIADAKFVPDARQWKLFFNTHVFPIIKTEMLNSIPRNLLSTFETLSVFRRFDPLLLAACLERGVLGGNVTKISDFDRQARELRKRLVETYLVNEPSKDETMYTMNFAVRRALSLNMQYNKVNRYQATNAEARDIFCRWLQDKKIPPSRSVVSLIEVIYHTLKAFEMQPNITVQDICHQTQAILEEHLALLLVTINENQWPNYLPLLRSYWEADEELQETAQRITGGTECYETLLHQIEKFVKENVG
ncbi:MAG: AAA family ATPase [Anaerolineae bacterium]|nr:AAA family ATPase [Anaerolineae bacterium]